MRRLAYRVTRYRFAKPDRCAASVFHKDRYRIRRGRGLRMHYTEAQCSRRPAKGSDYCWQHSEESAAPDDPHRAEP